MDWKPPKSPIGMLQEEMWPNVWQILVVCILHNQTSRKQVDKVYKDLFKEYSSPQDMSKASQEDLSALLKPLGLYRRRSKSLIKFSQDFLKRSWTLPSEMYGCGKYADDCYKVFCTGEWKSVQPTDHALKDYVDWLRERESNNA